MIVSVGCGRADMEMHSCDLHICLDIDKRALFCAKFAMRYLFRMKGNDILQHYNMNDWLSHILTQTQEKLPTIELIVLFQHPHEKRIVCNDLITVIKECLEMCFMTIIGSVHFVYGWYPNKNCWNVNELKTIIMDNSNINFGMSELLWRQKYCNSRLFTGQSSSTRSSGMPRMGTNEERWLANYLCDKEYRTLWLTKNMHFIM